MKRRLLPLIVFTVSFIYLISLSAKEWTWMFISSDSGDWLAASKMWMVPQPMGSPLFILLGHLLNSFPGDLVLKMTIILSCLSSAMTVTVVYIITQKLTSNYHISLACSLLLLSSAVFLTQSTVIEEYALATMFMTLAFWSYISMHKTLVGIFLGFAIAVHIFALMFALLWLVILHKNIKQWLGPIILTTILGPGMYLMILLLMYLDTPRLLAGTLSFDSVKSYLFDISGGIIGTMSVFEAPKRFLMIGQILLVSFSIGIISIIKSIKPLNTIKLLLLSNIIFILWYVLTTMDPISWTFITLISPSLILLCGLGLQKSKHIYTYLTIVVAIVLILVNAKDLNANTLTQKQPIARNYYNELINLPDNSIVVTTPGAYSLGLFYAISQGKKLIPLIYPYMEDWHFPDYYIWLNNKYGNVAVIKPNTIETIRANILSNQVYVTYTTWSKLRMVSLFTTEPSITEIRQLKEVQ